MRQYEASAKTKEEAIELGLQELGVSIGDVDVLVVEEGSKGLFGLFGSRPVKVRLTVKDSEEDPLGDLLEEKTAGKAEKKAEKLRRSGKSDEAAALLAKQEEKADEERKKLNERAGSGETREKESEDNKLPE